MFIFVKIFRIFDILNKDRHKRGKRMIIQITGNVKFSITLDPSVWIFDDRKILFEEAFNGVNQEEQINNDDAEKAAARWEQDLYPQRIKPPVNKSIRRYDREKILTNSYVMPIREFLVHAEINKDATEVKLETTNGEIILPLTDFQDCYLLFSKKGKPIQDQGPVHIYFRDGSNKDNPIKGVKKIIIL